MQSDFVFSKNGSQIGSFLRKKRLWVIKKIANGYSSEVFLVKNRAGKKFALKAEKAKSPRKNLAQKEASNLRLANSVGIGPRLFGVDEKAGVVLMGFVDGIPFSDWLFEKNPQKKVLQKFIDALLVQAKKLDSIGLDHGQLAGKGANILVRCALPVIIDFEKASQVRKCHNETQLLSFLFENPHGAVAKKVKEIL
ncbi:MAG: RIO1 family regulatory kinase/ATPase [archaeon]